MTDSSLSLTSIPARVARKLQRVVTDPSVVTGQFDVLRDLWSWERAHGPTLRDVISRTDPSRRVLVVSRTEFVYQIKLEVMFALALALTTGLRPTVIVPARNRWATRYFRASGITDLVTLEEFLSEKHERSIAAVTDEILGREVSFRALKAFEYRGAAVGRQVLATVSRRLRRGVARLDDDEATALVRELLPGALRSIHASEALIDHVRPQLVLFNEKGYAGFGSTYDVALGRSLDVIQFVFSHRDDAFILKRYTPETRGIHPTSLSLSSWQQIAAMTWTDAHEVALRKIFDDKYRGRWTHPNAQMHAGKVMPPRAELVEQLRLDPAKPIAVLFSHVLWDANLFYGEDLFADQEEWFVETIRAAVANPRLNWIVKLHPANVWKLRREVGALRYYELDLIERHFGELPPHVRTLLPHTDVSTLAIFRAADYGITIRGTVGYELPCFGAPVVTAGTGRYSGLGFTIDPPTRDEYLSTLARLEQIGRLDAEQVTLAKKHAYALFALRPCPFDSFRSVFRPPARGSVPLDHDLILERTSVAELERAEDLRDFAAWATGGEIDYLAPDPLGAVSAARAGSSAPGIGHWLR